MDTDKLAFLSAVEAGDASLVRDLVGRDAGLATARNADGTSALMLARYRRDTATVDAIRAGNQPLDIFEAAALGEADALAGILAANPAASRARSSDGFTALHFAAFFGGPEVARQLVESGADIDVVSQNDLQVAPLHSAVAGQLKVALLLIECGAKVNVRQRHGWTPLHGAADAGDEEVLAALLAAGADATARTDKGLTPADSAIAKGHADLAARLGDAAAAKLEVVDADATVDDQ
jgi:ankyrin repeat protein